jgi:S-disulfanyl-L-cysteine oxidoreductase SoxD
MKIIKYNQIVISFSIIAISGLSAHAQDKPWKDIGRPATPAEIKAWDIDVRGDFKGLPTGSGSVSRGEQVWESKCASCHGTFAESNEVFTPLVGGTTAEDIKSGRTASLAKGDTAQRTTLMKVSKLSTLWDYINRAMPWTAPKTLTTEEVYAVTAYILNLGGVVESNFTLSDQNIAQVQERLPNRNGTVLNDDLWNTSGKGDVKNVACMSNCETDPKINSSLPDFARNAHGNLAEQNRPVGEAHGIDTTKVAPNASAATKSAATDKPAPVDTANTQDVSALLKANSCVACHGMQNKIVGPGFNEIAAKYKGKSDIENYLVGKIKNGGSGTWGSTPMPPQTQLKDTDAKAIAQWLAAGAK